jgi:hypothetical protein
LFTSEPGSISVGPALLLGRFSSGSGSESGSRFEIGIRKIDCDCDCDPDSDPEPDEGLGFAKSSLVKQKDKGPSSYRLFNPAQPTTGIACNFAYQSAESSRSLSEN